MECRWNVGEKRRAAGISILDLPDPVAIVTTRAQIQGSRHETTFTEICAKKSSQDNFYTTIFTERSSRDNLRGTDPHRRTNIAIFAGKSS